MSVKNGQEAYNVLKSAKSNYLILLDLMMPIMSGWDLIQALKTKQPAWFKKNPIFILSAATDTKIGESLEVTGLFRKPVELEALLKTIHEYSA